MAHRVKLFKKSADKPSQLEDSVAKELHHLENSSSEWKNDLKDVYLSNVKEIEFTAKGKKSKPVYLVYVPFPASKLSKNSIKDSFLNSSPDLRPKFWLSLREPSNLSGKKTHKSQKRPYSRTLTAVHDAVLEDLLQPANIIGRRIRHRLDGSTVMKIILDQNDKDLIDDRLEAIAHVYKRISTKEITFEYRAEQTFYSTKKP
eukprot:CAMPEP_0176432134 /NCGR_PEP_ID=MMETSP0127-20121128/15212_1 /TAXON_ID=938130 /ORGANISM="Platyophrya macrostoma, Strain WH" /LENGTH=201 /DNA_ID=CAMNT_0017814245 /DNA_START=64 /DNA_END=670 /DNA_ORIENTATION=-